MATGMPTTQKFEGKSLVPAIEGKETLDNRMAFIETAPNNYDMFSVRTIPYKLIYHVEKNAVELYNIITDPGETKNLATKEPQVTKRLLDVVKSHMNR